MRLDMAHRRGRVAMPGSSVMYSIYSQHMLCAYEFPLTEVSVACQHFIMCNELESACESYGTRPKQLQGARILVGRL